MLGDDAPILADYDIKGKTIREISRDLKVSRNTVRKVLRSGETCSSTSVTIWEVFEAERPKLVPYAGRFDGFHAVPASVSKTCLVRFDNNKYSVTASAVGRPVEIHAYADRLLGQLRMGMHLGVGNAFIEQPGVQFVKIS